MKKLTLIWALLAAMTMSTATLAQTEEAPKTEEPAAEEGKAAEGAEGGDKKKKKEAEPDC